MINWDKLIGDLVGYGFIVFIILLIWSKMAGKSLKELLTDIGLLKEPENTLQERIKNKFGK